MGVLTLEGIVTENGQVQLKDKVRLPERTKVYVIVPDIRTEQVAHIFSPRLVHPEDVKDFTMEVIEESSDANL